MGSGAQNQHNCNWIGKVLKSHECRRIFEVKATSAASQFEELFASGLDVVDQLEGYKTTSSTDGF